MSTINLNTANHGIITSMAMTQEPKKMEVPIPYMFGLNFRGYPQKIWPEIWY
jgi:hypothetical protein